MLPGRYLYFFSPCFSLSTSFEKTCKYQTLLVLINNWGILMSAWSELCSFMVDLLITEVINVHGHYKIALNYVLRALLHNKNNTLISYTYISATILVSLINNEKHKTLGTLIKLLKGLKSLNIRIFLSRIYRFRGLNVWLKWQLLYFDLYILLFIIVKKVKKLGPQRQVEITFFFFFFWR